MFVFFDTADARERAGTQIGSGHNLTKGTAGVGRTLTDMDKQWMYVTMRGREERKGWTRLIQKQNFGRSGWWFHGCKKRLWLCMVVNNCLVFVG